MKQIELVEYQPIFLAQPAFSLAMGTKLWREFSDQIAIEFPSPKTSNQWRLTALGWVGHIPLTPQLQLTLTPKVHLHNLFRMWEYAYAMHAFRWLEGIANSESLAEFYERLASRLAKQVLHRGQMGFYRTYVEFVEQLPYVRGRIQHRQAGQELNQVGLICRHDEHTADIPDNQILSYTLAQIARSQRCGEQVQTAVRRAYHTLQTVAPPRPFQPQDCVGRPYTRLNQDYQPLHALCRFFLEHTGPAYGNGRHHLRPFLINMARLYELFVSEWLKTHLPTPWHIKAQEHVTVGKRDELRFDIDLVLYDEDNQPYAVLDTKYKVPDKPSNADFSQIVTYAKAKGCREAVLIYPANLPRPFHIHIGDIRVRSLTFSVDGNLEEAGQRFLTTLLK